MKTINTILCIGLSTLLLSACGSSDGSASSGGGGGGTTSIKDASSCVSRSLRKVYVNECNYAINAIIFKTGESSFHIGANDAVSRSSTGNSFGACRAPSTPVLNADSSGFRCS